MTIGWQRLDVSGGPRDTAGRWEEVGTWGLQTVAGLQNATAGALLSGSAFQISDEDAAGAGVGSRVNPVREGGEAPRAGAAAGPDPDSRLGHGRGRSSRRGTPTAVCAGALADHGAGPQTSAPAVLPSPPP